MREINVPRVNSRKGTGGYRLDANPGECVIWDGNLNENGYGRLWVEYGDGKTTLRYAHRMAWEAWRFPIPPGMTIDHLCASPACVNPDHLDLVTLSENARRANKRVTHCPRGHAYSQENTYVYRSGSRMCRTCHRVKVSESRKHKRSRTEQKED